MSNYDNNGRDFGFRENRAIEELEDKVNENNKILRGIQRSKHNAIIWNVIKWVFLILLALYVWSILEPIYQAGVKTINDAQESYTEISSGIKQSNEFLNSFSTMFDNLFEVFPQFESGGEDTGNTVE